MSTKQLVALFICNIFPPFIINALIPLLPVYAVELGGDETVAGLFLGVSFATLTASVLLSGWLADRFQQRKRTMLLAFALAMPSLFLMRFAPSVAALTLLTMATWFMLGIVFVMVRALVALSANPARRGRVFGIITMTLGMGQMLGGLVAGPIVDHWGFGALFTTLALVPLLPLAVGLLIEDVRLDITPAEAAQPSAPILNRAFVLLMLGNVIANAIMFATNLGRPLHMHHLGFDATAISSATVFGGLVAMPMPLLAGWLSDRYGRKQMMIFAYAGVFLAPLLLVTADALWLFWLSTMFGGLLAAAASVGSAMAIDLVPARARGMALSRFMSTGSGGGIIGYMLTGFLLSGLGMQTTFLFMAGMALVAMTLVGSIRQGAPARLAAQGA